MESYLGTIMLWAGNFAPRGWMWCDGKELPIANNEALFTLLGTTHGGNGQTSFGLPNMVGRFVMGTSSNVTLGKTGGGNVTATSNVTLIANNLPAHTHPGSINLGTVTATTVVKVSTDDALGATAPTEGAMLTGTTPGTSEAAFIYLPPGTAPSSPVSLGNVTTTYTGTPSVTVSPNITDNKPGETTPITFTGSAPTQPPALALGYIICVEGIYPPRN